MKKEVLGCEEIREYPGEFKKKLARWVDASELQKVIDDGGEVFFDGCVFVICFPNDDFHYFRVIPGGQTTSTEFFANLCEKYAS